MIRYRLINCDFLNASTFLKLTNKAKLLYLMMITNADDLGFVGNTHNLIEELTNNDDMSKQVSLELLKNDYISALVELTEKTYIYRFVDKHNNEIYVIKHWFMHNKYRKNLQTNYFTFYKRLEMENGEYFLKPLEKETIKENKVKETKVKQSNKEIVNKETENNFVDNLKDYKMTDEEWDNMLDEIKNSKPPMTTSETVDDDEEEDNEYF